MGKKVVTVVVAILLLSGVMFFVLANRNTSVAPTPEDAKNMTQPPNESAQSGVKEFTVTAKSWEFSPATITVQEGDKVRLKVTSLDVTHGFAIPEFDVNENLRPGTETLVEFTADKKGTYTYYCSVMCGAGHQDMKGTLLVQ